MRGEINLLVQVGPHTCQVTFQVMHINPAYSCLLGRPWIHALGVVPLTLHQKLKFVVKDLLVIISGEKDLLISCPSSMPYVEAAEEALGTAFQSFEIVSNASMESLPMCPRMSSAAIMVARGMLGNGYEPGTGLGKNNDGRPDLVDFKENSGRFGLGYKPTRANIRKTGWEKRNGGTGLQLRAHVKEALPCHLNESFVSAGLRCEEEVAAVHNKSPQGCPDLVQPCLPGFQLGNWKVMEWPEVSLASIM